MDAALWVSKTGLDAQQTRMNVISNNLANVSTTGFKRDRAVFEDLLYQNIRQAGAQSTANTQSPTGLMLGTGTKVVATEKLHLQGNMINSQNPLDVAIMGDGFFQIQQQDGTVAYTRDEQTVGIEVELMEWQLKRRWTHQGDLGTPMLDSPIAKQSRD